MNNIWSDSYWSPTHWTRTKKQSDLEMNTCGSIRHAPTTQNRMTEHHSEILNNITFTSLISSMVQLTCPTSSLITFCKSSHPHIVHVISVHWHETWIYSSQPTHVHPEQLSIVTFVRHWSTVDHVHNVTVSVVMTFRFSDCAAWLSTVIFHVYSHLSPYKYVWNPPYSDQSDWVNDNWWVK